MKPRILLAGSVILLMMLCLPTQAQRFSPERFADRCISGVERNAERCCDFIDRMAQQCVQRLEYFLENGNTTRVERIATVYSMIIKRRQNLSIRMIERSDRLCVRLLERFGADDLAQDVYQECQKQIERINTAAEAALEKIQEAASGSGSGDSGGGEEEPAE